MASKYQFRSISLPTRSHPSTIRIEEELNKLQTWESSSSASTSESICIGLSGLQDLHNSLDELLNKASTQEILSQHRREKSVEELLDESVKLLDICSTARDAMLQFKKQVQSLQSALRRRRGDSSIESSISAYTHFRKTMKKDAKRLITTLKKMDNKAGTSSIQYQDHHFSAVIRVLREVNVINNSVFRSLLMFLTMPVSKPRQSRWSLVSKLVYNVEQQENLNVFGSVDDVFSEGPNSEKVKSHIAEQRLETLDSSSGEIEKYLESVFRRLIKTRASILNIISQ